MRKQKLVLAILAGLAVAAFVAAPAKAVTTYDTSLAAPGVYYGLGNEANDEGWTKNTQGSVEVALTAIQRGVGATVDPLLNVYNVSLGNSCPNGSNCGARAWFNFDLSVNVRADDNSSMTLADVIPWLTLTNVGNGATISFNPFLAFGDNSAYGPDGTRNGNVPGQQAIGSDYGFQNSQNPVFFPIGWDFSASNTLLVALSVLDAYTYANLGSVNIVINAGLGASVVPIPGALPLFAGGLGGLGLLAFLRRRQRSTGPVQMA